MLSQSAKAKEHLLEQDPSAGTIIPVHFQELFLLIKYIPSPECIIVPVCKPHNYASDTAAFRINVITKDLRLNYRFKLKFRGYTGLTLALLTRVTGVRYNIISTQNMECHSGPVLAQG